MHFNIVERRGLVFELVPDKAHQQLLQLFGMKFREADPSVWFFGKDCRFGAFAIDLSGIEHHPMLKAVPEIFLIALDCIVLHVLTYVVCIHAYT